MTKQITFTTSRNEQDLNKAINNFLVKTKGERLLELIIKDNLTNFEIIAYLEING